jgi:hypothetical protein
VILNAVVDADAVAIVAADVAAAIVAAGVDVAALTAVVVVVVVLTAVVGVAALTAAAGVAASIVAVDAGDPVVLLPVVAPLAVLSFVAGDRLLSLAPSHPLRMSRPSASNVQDMGPPGGWSKSSPIISRPNWIRAPSTITTVCASPSTRKNALNRSSLVLPPVVGKNGSSFTCALLITIHHSHFT